MNNPSSYPPGEPAPVPASPPQQVIVQGPTTPPLVTYLIIAACVLVYIAQLATQNLLGVDVPAALGMKANDWIVRGELWRLLTPMFLHGSIIHIAFNMYALYQFGPLLERQYGHKRFLVLYFLGGFAGNVFSFALSQAPSLGSSTAIFGLLGAQGVFMYQNRELYGSRARGAITQIVTIAVINLMIGLSPGIDNWGHVGGLLGGTAFAWFAGPLLHLEGLFPNLTLTDRREDREVFLAACGVALVFAILAGVLIFARR